jgi:hypothetical protein
MDYSKKTRDDLISLCKEQKIKGYSGKKREDIIALLQPVNIVVNDKKDKGQFYTTQSSYILEGFDVPSDARCIMEPFAGQGDLIDWAKQRSALPIESYDIQPKRDDIQQRDTLHDPPNYENAWILTNPPYLARNKSQNKQLYDQYDTNDLYKCFLSSVVKQGNCRGGIVIIPSGFFFSSRDLDVRCRHEFMKLHRITKVKFFEETVFDDTSTTIVAFSFERSPIELTEQNVEWETLPTKEKRVFSMTSANQWIVGGEIYRLPVPEGVHIRRHVEGQALKENEQQTFITLNALDSGTMDGRIKLTYQKDYVYPAKDCSRTYATLRIRGMTLTEEQQIFLCSQFNDYVERKRTETWSLFLPQFRESKEYARKRIPFELAYLILLHLLTFPLPS